MVVLDPATYLAELQVDDAGEQKLLEHQGEKMSREAAANRPALCSAGNKMLRCKSYRRSANGGTLPFSRNDRLNPQYIKADLIQVAVTTRDFYEYTP